MKNDEAMRKIVRREFDAGFSFLNEQPSLRPEILKRIKGERVVKRKISVALVFALVAALAAVTALAATLSFSTNYDVKRAALDALEEKYGVTEEMMTLLHVELGEIDENGAQTVTFTPVERAYADRAGEYAVTVQGGKATASWSHDGEEIGEGMESPVYGAQQLKLLCTNYGEVMAYLLAENGGESIEPAVTPAWPEVGDIETYMANQQKEWEERKAAALAAAKLSIEECKALAIEAIRGEYELTDVQMQKLVAFVDEWGLDDRDAMDFTFEDGHPIVSMLFGLFQSETIGVSEDWSEKDGQYWVDVNMDTGVIENILYDSMLASNG